MKRVLLLVLICVMLALPAECAEYNYTYGDSTELYPESDMDSLFSSLPDEVKGELADFLAAQDDTERSEALKGKLDIGFWLGYIGKVISSMFLPNASGCVTVLCVILLSKIASGVVALKEGGAISGIYSLTVTLVCSVAVMELAVSAVNTAVEYIDRICSMMTAMLPVMEAVMLSSGSVSQASLNGTSLMIYITLTENFLQYVMIPLAGTLFALSATSGTFSSVNTSSLVSAVRRVLMTVLGFFLLIFSFVLGIQSSLAKSADSLAMKTVRFAVGSYIPIVGGALSEALTTVSAGLTLVRRTVGGIGIVIILFIVLPPLISLFLTRLSLLICKSVAEFLECEDAARVIGDADSAISLFCAFAVMSAVFFIFAVTLFMNSGLS